MNKKKQLLGLANMQNEFSEIISCDGDASYKYLSDQGLNPEEILKEGLQKVKSYILTKKASLRKSQVETILEKATIRVRKIIEENKHKSKESLIQILLEKSPAFQFRNLEQLTDDDIRDVLADVDLLKFLNDTD